VIVLAALLAAPLAPGCRRVESAIRCELAPAVQVAAPPPARVTQAAKPVPRTHRRTVDRSPVRRKVSPPPAPTPAEIAHHVEALVSIADCTGARTLLVSTGSATADSTYHACIGIGLNPASSGHDLGAVPREATAAGGGGKPVEHPQ
jgi:hypothetical protein